MTKFKSRVVVFDLEATCEHKSIDPNFPHQIIEIGAVDTDGNQFSKFVRPTIATELTPFCKKLTTIKQSDVDNAETFESVNSEFFKFYDGATIVSWGKYDCNQMVKEISLSENKAGLDYMKTNHVNLKDLYKEVTGSRAGWMPNALKSLGLELKGTHHRGIDDAINIMEIFKALVKLKEEQD